MPGRAECDELRVGRRSLRQILAGAAPMAPYSAMGTFAVAALHALTSAHPHPVLAAARDRL